LWHSRNSLAHLFRTTGEHPEECSKSPSSKAAGESKPEAYPLGSVENFDESRTPLADFFSILLGAAAFRTKGGFFCCITLSGGQGKELFALEAGANFEVGGSLVVDVGGQEQLQRVISNRAAVGEFDDGQAVVKDLEGSFLPFSDQYMPEDEHRLPLTFRAEVS
jgi:hypothetical protein